VLPYEVVVEVEHLDPEEDVPSTALLLPAGEVIIEAFDPVLEGLVQPLHEVLPSDGVDVVLYSKPSAGLMIPSPFVRPDWLPAIPGAEVPDEVVGVQDVPLVGDPEAKELPVKGVEGDLDHASFPLRRIMVSSIRMECTEPLLTRNLLARKENLWAHWRIAS
jgi:hypothetical protein